MKFISRKVYFIFAVTLLGVGTNAHAQNANQKVSMNFDLGSLLEKPKLIVVERFALNGDKVALDTIVIRTNKFEQSYHLGEPQLFKMSFVGGNVRITTLSYWLRSGSIKVSFDGKSKPNTQISDSLFNNKIDKIEIEKTAYEQLSNTLVKKVNYQNKSISIVEKEIDKIRDSIDHLIDERVYKTYFNQNLDNPIGLYALVKYASRPFTNQRIKAAPEKIAAMRQQLGHKILRLPSSLVFLQKIALAKQLSIGQRFKNIILPDTTGKLVNIGDYKGKYVLVDFWANWCAPCRQEHPFYVDAFEKYSKQGFQILSITRDDVGAKKWWLKAIKDDKIGKWIHLSDFDNIAKKTYNIEFIPTNYLIDPNGIIIARDLRGDNLISKLASIFEK